MIESKVAVTYDDVRAAAGRLRGVAHRTPVVTSRTLDERTGARVFLKAENLQRMGAFKFRGAYNRLAQLTTSERAGGVVAFSSGNHAQGVALAAQLLGIPAAIVTKYLAEHGIIVEKTGLYSFFIMFTIGITKGRWNSMVTELQQFKDDYDNNQPLWRVLPDFIAQHPSYERMGLRDLCEQIHSVYRANNIARLTTEMYLSSMEPAMKPSEAYAKLVHREIDRVPIDELEGRAIYRGQGLPPIDFGACAKSQNPG